jgi:hypothetical protein
VVTKATAKYLMAEDSSQAWMEECGIEDMNTWVSSAMVWQSWSDWCDKTGERPGNRKLCPQALKPALKQPEAKQSQL